MTPTIPPTAHGPSILRLIERWSDDFRIIGIVDYYGAVHSRIAKCGEDHNKHFGWRMNKCWDWSVTRQTLYHDGAVDVEDKAAIMRHLGRKGLVPKPPKP